MKILPLTKVDVTRYAMFGPQVTWLVNNGFRIKVHGNRVYMVHDA